MTPLVISEVTTFSFQSFDKNSNGILDGQETVNWRREIKKMDFDIPKSNSSLEFYSEYKARNIADLKRIWTESEMDGDNKTATKAELVQFFLRLWNTLDGRHYGKWN